LIEESWPAVAPRAGRHDVALAAHVVYDVADLAPFLQALHRRPEPGWCWRRVSGTRGPG